MVHSGQDTRNPMLNCQLLQAPGGTTQRKKEIRQTYFKKLLLGLKKESTSANEHLQRAETLLCKEKIFKQVPEMLPFPQGPGPF